LDLAALLEAMTSEEGLSFALVVGRDGILVGSASAGSIDADTVGVLASRGLQDLERLGRAAQGGAVRQIRLRYAGCEVFIETLVTSDLLVVGVSGLGSTERLLDALARNRKHIAQALSEL
jgi:predicted regulator of Ras-like GTPase activity (Roadblock/LC7/MglB family)